MTHRKAAVWTERLVLALILASLGATLNLAIAIHRRAHSPSTASKAPNPPPSPPPAPKPSPIVRKSDPAPPPPRKPDPPPRPPEDPTAPILARIDRAIAQESEAARAADRRAADLQQARRTSVAESERWKRREMLVRQQITKLNRRADKLEEDALTLDAERDVLARERDALQAALAKSSQNTGYAVLPYKGPNGTWRRPIVLECSGNSVKLQPHGPTFSILELSPLIHPRSSPAVLAIAREMMHIQRAETPDGAPAVPYLVFLVRPDGIRSYYMARNRLEPLGIAFGYELIEQDLSVEIPDLDDVRTWDGSAPLDVPGGDARPRGNGGSTTESPRGGDSTWPRGDRPGTGDDSGPGTWPPSRGRPDPDRRWPDIARGDGSGGRVGEDASASGVDLGGTAGRGGSGDGSPDDFVWPTTSGAAGASGSRGAGRRMGRAGADDTGGGFAGMPRRGRSSRGFTGTPEDIAASPAGRPGPDRLVGGEPGARSPEGSSGRTGSASGPGDSNPGRLLARGGETGTADVSSPGRGSTRGGAGRADANGSGAGGTDPLPELQPVRPGPSTFGTPMPSGGSGDGESVGSRSGSSTMRGGSAPGDPGGSGKPLGIGSGGPGNAAISGGSHATDPGFSPYPAGVSLPGQNPPDSGPGTGARVAPGAGGRDSGAAGSDATGDAATRDGPTGASQPPLIRPSGPYSPGGGGDSLSPSPRGSGERVPEGRVRGPMDPTAGAAPSSALQAPSPRGGEGDGQRPARGQTAAGASSDLTRPAQRGEGASPGASSTSDNPGEVGGSFPTIAGLPSSTPTPPSNVGLPPAFLGGLLGSSAISNAAAGAFGGLGSASSESNASGSMSGSSGGQAASSTSAGASGMSLPGPTAGSDSGSESDDLKELSLPPIQPHRPRGAIDVPFEIVVVCRRDDLLLHPGGYRITGQALQAGTDRGGDEAEALLQRELKSIVRRRAQVDPLIRPRPRLKFLVEAGGSSTFWTARKQLTFSSLDWPMSVQVAGPQLDDPLDGRTRR